MRIFLCCRERKQPVEGKKDETEVIKTEKSEEYVSFEQAWAKKWTSVPFKRQKRVSPALFAFQGAHVLCLFVLCRSTFSNAHPFGVVLLSFENEKGHLPGTGEKDLEGVLEVKKALFAAIEADERVLEDDFLKIFLTGIGAEIAPVTAILGGFVAQEIIKVLSGKDLPISNFFLFDGRAGVGSVEEVK